MIVDGFDLESPLVCEGIIGDGCGGGRIFYVKDDKLFAYDPQSKTNIELQENLKQVTSLSKRGCIISITFKDEEVLFDLSKLKE